MAANRYLMTRVALNNVYLNLCVLITYAHNKTNPVQIYGFNTNRKLEETDTKHTRKLMTSIFQTLTK